MQLLDLFPDICLKKLSYDVVHASIFQRSCLLSYFAFANWLCTNILDIWDCTLFDFYWAQWCINRDDLGFELENETSLFLVIEKAPLSCSQLFFSGSNSASCSQLLFWAVIKKLMMWNKWNNSFWTAVIDESEEWSSQWIFQLSDDHSSLSKREVLHGE